MTTQLVILRAFFHPPDHISEKKSCKLSNKKHFGLSDTYISDRISDDIPPQMKLLNTVIP